MLFELVVLAEYFVAPAFLGVTNYAGVWSEIGTILFVALVVSLVVLVLAPLWPRLRELLRDRRQAALFHGVWIGAFVAGLFLTNVLQFPDDRVGGGLLVGQTTIYTPLGAWPSLTIYISSINFWAVLNVEQPTILLLLSVLSAASLVLARVPRCAVTSPAAPLPRGRLERFLSVSSLGPLGFVTACPTCFPAYFSLIALLAPSVATTGYLAIPLVPWIGLAGLLYIAGFYLVVRSLALVTDDRRGVLPHGAPSA